MPADIPILIAGAGPTGLAAALFLADLGVVSRIVDPAPQPSQTSKALAINPRSLELLEPSGVTAKVLAEARPVHTMQIRRGDKLLATLSVDDIGTKFPMSVIPQARTEALLTEALLARGIVVNREVAVETVKTLGDMAEVGLRHADGTLETSRGAIVCGADGAHSVVRHQIGVGFPGEALRDEWSLIDVTLDAPVTDSEGYIEFLPHHGLVFAMAFTPQRWRVIVAAGDPMQHLPPGRTAKTVHWASDFKISHRIAESLNVGRVCLGGDAAHLHSPMGARGMNLGIEDAYVFAQLAKRALDERSTDALATYGRVRHEADAGVVARVKFATETVLGFGPAGRMRAAAPYLLPAIAPIRAQLLRIVTGMDHPLKLS